MSIDTSPEALRALARKWDEDWAAAEEVVRTLRAVAAEKKAGCTWAFSSWEDHLDACERKAFQDGKKAAEKEAQVVPEGWALVPMEFTSEMVKAWDGYDRGDKNWSDAYREMLAAAPKTP